MFGKKKDPLAAKPKAPLAKKAERGFFHIFNNKSKARRVAFVGVLAWLPAWGGTMVMQETPDTKRGADGAAQVQKYESDISRIAQNSQTTTTLAAARIDSADLVKRLVEDTSLSEQDAEDLARRFLNDVETGNIDPSVVRMMRSLYLNTEYLEEARVAVANSTSDVNIADRVISTLEKADDMNDSDYWYRFFLTYVFIFPAMQAGVNAMLRRGARRDDELKKEETREIAQDKIRDIRDMLTPRSQSNQPTITYTTRNIKPK